VGDDPHAALNQAFRALYATNRAELVRTVPLAAVTHIGTAEIARIEFGRITKTYPPAHAWIAHAKGLMHGLLAVQAVGSRIGRGAAGEGMRRDAMALAMLLDRAATLAPASLPNDIVAPASRVLAAGLALARRWTDAADRGPGDVRRTFDAVRGDLAAVLDRVGEAVYASVVSGFTAMRAESRPEDWDSCIVLVCGPPFGRRDNIEFAAATQVLGAAAVGTRLLYVENVTTFPAAIDQLAAAIADRDLGADIFADPVRLWRDLLGDVARRHAGGGFFPETGRP
jgi:hypothetical protein